MYRGNFDIEDYLIERTALRHAEVSGDSITLSSAPGQAPRLRLTLDCSAMRLTALDDTVNRLWLRVVAETDEHVWGGGEQMSYFDLRGRRFPLWTSEPGVGRDKTTEITFKAPGDDLLCGIARRYRVVTSDKPINASNFDQAQAVGGAPTPEAAGSTQSYTLRSSAKRYVAIRAVDDQGNVGRPVVVDLGPTG